MKELEFRESLYDRDLNGLDSEYTYTTRLLIESFEADGAHLNRWWVMTGIDWSCPCCKRKKSEIVRLNKNNYLTCQLHEHHDHMKDFVKSLFEKISTSMKKIVADELSEKFAVKTAFSLSAYDNTIVCFDCNKADADAKKIVGSHKYFSFSPKEITEFVISRPNQGHDINKIEAKRVWERVRPIFDLRLEMAEKFATIAAVKQDWYQPSDRTALQTERLAKYHFDTNGLLDVDKYDPEKLLYNTDPFIGENSSWRVKKNSIVKTIPSENELSHLAATRGKFWNRYEYDWICPSCKRDKFSCVRPSKKNPWIFEVKSTPLFCEDKEKVTYINICCDCLDTSVHLGREIIKESGFVIDFPSSIITILELSKVVIPRSHSMHLYNNEEINQLIPTLIKRAELMKS